MPIDRKKSCLRKSKDAYLEQSDKYLRTNNMKTYKFQTF